MDSVIVFRQLSKEHIRAIVDIIIGQVNERLVEQEIFITATTAAKDWLGEHGYDPEFGARPLRRLIQAEVEDRLSDAFLSGQLVDNGNVMVDVVDDGIVIRSESGLPLKTVLDEGEVELSAN